MPVTYRILRQLSLIYVRFDGYVGTEETIAAMQACGAHPDFRPEHRTIVDFSHATGYDRDWMGLMRMQAVAASSLYSTRVVPTLLYWAPTPIGQIMAQAALRSWEGVTAINARILTERDQVIAVLGVHPDKITTLLPEMN
jgi:hypothetical protein